MKNLFPLVLAGVFTLGLSACSADGLLGPDSDEYVMVGGDATNQGVGGDATNQGVGGDATNQGVGGDATNQG